MRAKTIIDQDSRPVIRPSLCLRIKYTLNLVQADGGVGIFSLGTAKVPPRSGVSRPGAPMCGCWPDDERIKRLTVYGDTFDCRDQSPLDTCSSVVQADLSSVRD
jgi:hypothetical protein